MAIQTNLNNYQTSLALDDFDNGDSGKVTDFFRYGLTSSVASGAMSFVNTGAAFANAFGAEFEYTDTKDVLEGMGMTATAQYYDQNRDWVDTAGFVIGAVVPGLGGIKAAQAMKAGITGYQGSSKFVLGIKDAVYSKSAVQSYTQRLLKEGSYPETTGQFIRDAAKEGFRDTAVETAFAEAAILLTMNQSPTMTGTELRYFQSIGSNLDSAALGFVFGTGIGGVIATAQGAKVLRSIVETPLQQVNKLAPNTVAPADLNKSRLPTGDFLARLSAEKASAVNAAEEITSGGIQGDAFAIRQLNKKVEDTETTALQYLAQLTAPIKGAKPLTDFSENAPHLTATLKQVWDSADPETANEIFGGLRKASSLGEEAVMMDVRLSPLKLLKRDEDLMRQSVLETFGEEVDVTSPTMIDFIDRQVAVLMDSNGATYPSKAWGVAPGKSLTYVFDDPDAPLWKKIFVARHEIGHNQTDRVAKLFNTKFGESIKAEAIELSKEMRPSAWAQVKRYEEILNKSADEWELMGLTSADIDEYRNFITYMNKPQELLADSWAAFETELFKPKRTESPLYSILAQNSAAKSLYGENEMLLDSVTGDLRAVADRVPTVADMGKVTARNAIGNKVTVNHSGGTTVWDRSAAYDPEQEDFMTASAKFYAASRDSAFLGKNVVLDATNLPMMLNIIKRAESTDGKVPHTDITLKTVTGESLLLEFSKLSTSPELKESLVRRLRTEQIKAKAALLEKLRNGTNISKTGKYGELEIARILDISEDSVNTLGVVAASDDGIEMLLAPKARAAISWSEVYDPTKPTGVKLSYAASRRTEADVDALADVERRYQRNLQFNSVTVDTVYKKFFKDEITLIDSIAIAGNSSENLANRVTSVTPVGGLVTATQGNYTDAVSFAQQVGASHRKAELAGKLFVEEAVGPAAGAVKRSPEALAEYASLDSYLRTGHFVEVPNGDINGFVNNLNVQVAAMKATPAKGMSASTYLTNSAQVERLVKEQIVPTIQRAGGTTQLMSQDFVSALEDMFAKPTVTNIRKVNSMLPKQFKPVHSPELVDMFRAATQVVYPRHVEARGAIASIDGGGKNIDPSVWYPGRWDSKRYKEMAFVVPKVKGLFADNKKMVVGGPTREAFDTKVQQVRDAFGDDVRIVTPQEASEYYKLLQEHDRDLAFTDWDVNNMMYKRGVLSDIAPEPTPQMVDHFMASMQQDWATLNTTLFSRKYSEEVSILQRAHRSNSVKSGTPVTTQIRKDKEVVTPYSKVLDVMFNKQSKDLESYRGFQDKFDNAFSGVINTIGQMFKLAKDPLDFDKLNTYASQFGLPQVYNPTVRDYLVKTEKVDDRLLSKWIPKINSVAATLMLRLDYIQPIVTAISMPVTMHPEFKHLLAEIPELRRQATLKQLSVLNPETGTREQSLYPLMLQATKDYVQRKDLHQQYESLGLLGGIGREQVEAIDLVTLSKADWTAGDAAIEPKWQKAATKLKDVAVRPADKAEEYAKFTAARVAQLVTETAGVTDPSIQARVMRTFVTRTMGNYNAAQRPGLFQGPIGQLVGLFQTYQFNIIQQMLRHAGEEPSRVAAMMGIQAGIFGAQSVPGFQILNAHIAEKSDYRDDFYTAANQAFGESVGEWIVYGAASNFTIPFAGDGIELYTRGDLNPRTPILIPTSLEEVPAIGMASRAWSALSTAAGSIGEGAPTTEAFLQAVSTLGVNRPLAGLAQIAQGARTTSNGTVLARTGVDDLNWQQMVMRAMGSKGLDESIAVNAYYRSQQYESERQARINELGIAARTYARSGVHDSTVYQNFMQKYVEYGGKQPQFASWMHRNYINGTQPVVSSVATDNRGVVGRYMQTLMGTEPTRFEGGMDETGMLPNQAQSTVTFGNPSVESDETTGVIYE